LGCFEIQ